VRNDCEAITTKATCLKAGSVQPLSGESKTCVWDGECKENSRKSQQSNTFPWWIILIVMGVLIIIALIILFIVYKKRKKKKPNDEEVEDDSRSTPLELDVVKDEICEEKDEKEIIEEIKDVDVEKKPQLTEVFGDIYIIILLIIYICVYLFPSVMILIVHIQLSTSL
jgi:uncharacterized membrane protein